MSGRFRKRGHAPQTVLTDEDVAYLERNTRCVTIMMMMMAMIMVVSGTMRRTSESGSGTNFGSVMSSLCHNVCMSIRSAQTCLEP